MGIKITVVGDGIVGKTCLLSTYTQGTFPEKYVPTVFENHNKQITVDGETYETTLWDTAGQEDYERLRPLAYPHTNCFLICFCVDKNLASYDNARLKWAPEIYEFNKHVPIVLVATKTDLRDNPSIACYTPSDGEHLMKKIKAHAYVECSALRCDGLDEVFEAAVRSHLRQTTKKNNKCTVL